jgi:energy-converting hydrogenase Eha subunit A
MLLLKALKLLGLDLPAYLHLARAALQLRIDEARHEARQAARNATVIAAFVTIAVVSALALVAVGLMALYLKVTEFYGPYAGLGAVAGVLAALMLICALIVARRFKPQPRAAMRDPRPPRAGAVPHAAAGRDASAVPVAVSASSPLRRSAKVAPEGEADIGAAASRAAGAATDVASDLIAPLGALLSYYLSSPATHPLLTEGLRHLRTRVEDPTGDPLDVATHVVRDGDRTHMLAVLAGAAFIGWLVARPSRHS